MSDSGIGRLLVASLHQGIADLLPSRLEFYESWLHPIGLREGRIGLAPLTAALSFLRQEGEPYHLVAARAGQYTAEWTVAGLAPLHRGCLRSMPVLLRQRFVLRLVRTMVRSTYGGSRAHTRWSQGRAIIHIRGSLFCQVRTPVDQPLCTFYVSAIHRVMQLFNLPVAVDTSECRATGAGECVMSMQPGRNGQPGGQAPGRSEE